MCTVSGKLRTVLKCCCRLLICCSWVVASGKWLPWRWSRSAFYSQTYNPTQILLLINNAFDLCVSLSLDGRSLRETGNGYWKCCTRNRGENGEMKKYWKPVKSTHQSRFNCSNSNRPLAVGKRPGCALCSTSKQLQQQVVNTCDAQCLQTYRVSQNNTPTEAISNY